MPFRGVFAGDPRHSAKVGAVGAMTRTWPDGEISRSGDPRSGDDAAIDEGGLGGASASAIARVGLARLLPPPTHSQTVGVTVTCCYLPSRP